MKTRIGIALMILTCLSRAAFAVSEFDAEFIFPLQPKHCHSSSLVECPNGDLLACWFQGSGERSAGDVAILGARLRKGSSVWSEPFIMADTSGLADCNPVLNRSQ